MRRGELLEPGPSWEVHATLMELRPIDSELYATWMKIHSIGRGFHPNDRRLYPIDRELYPIGM